MSDAEKSQLDRFKEAARELGADDGEARLRTAEEAGEAEAGRQKSVGE